MFGSFFGSTSVDLDEVGEETGVVIVMTSTIVFCNTTPFDVLVPALFREEWDNPENERYDHGDLEAPEYHDD